MILIKMALNWASRKLCLIKSKALLAIHFFIELLMCLHEISMACCDLAPCQFSWGIISYHTISQEISHLLICLKILS